MVECDEKSGTMYTVRAAYDYKRPIGCYYSDDLKKGSYGGNEYMVSNLNAAKILGTKELIEFLLPSSNSTMDTNEVEETIQLSLTDYMNV